MNKVAFLLVIFSLAGCGGSTDKAKLRYKYKSRDKIAYFMPEIFSKFDDSKFDRNCYPEKNLTKVSDFLGWEKFNFRGEPSDFNDTFGNPYMIRRSGDQWEIIAFGYNKINEDGGGDDIVFPFGEDYFD